MLFFYFPCFFYFKLSKIHSIFLLFASSAGASRKEITNLSLYSTIPIFLGLTAKISGFKIFSQKQNNIIFAAIIHS